MKKGKKFNANISRSRLNEVDRFEFLIDCVNCGGILRISADAELEKYFEGEFSK